MPARHPCWRASNIFFALPCNVIAGHLNGVYGGRGFTHSLMFLYYRYGGFHPRSPHYRLRVARWQSITKKPKKIFTLQCYCRPLKWCLRRSGLHPLPYVFVLSLRGVSPPVPPLSAARCPLAVYQQKAKKNGNLLAPILTKADNHHNWLALHPRHLNDCCLCAAGAATAQSVD